MVIENNKSPVEIGKLKVENGSFSAEVRSFQDLDCWKKCREIRKLIIEVTAKFPKEELFALTQNMRRAAYSTTQNIAEGYGRFHYQENIQFCRQSRGSLYELWDQLITANDNGYISEEQLKKIVPLINQALKLLNGYINYLIREQKSTPRKKSKTLADGLPLITIFYFLFSIFSW